MTVIHLSSDISHYQRDTTVPANRLQNRLSTKGQVVLMFFLLLLTLYCCFLLWESVSQTGLNRNINKMLLLITFGGKRVFWVTDSRRLSLPLCGSRLQSTCWTAAQRWTRRACTKHLWGSSPRRRPKEDFSIPPTWRGLYRNDIS